MYFKSLIVLIFIVIYISLIEKTITYILINKEHNIEMCKLYIHITIFRFYIR